MRNYKLATTFFWALFCFHEVKAQDMRVEIGQLFPDTRDSKIIQYSTPSIQLSQIKNKIIIIDFWNTHCISCIASFPKLEALQEKFKDRVLIVPVTYESEKLVNEFILRRNSIGKKISLPSIVEDTILRTLFPHDGDPYEIWIDEAGRVMAITDNNAIHEENILTVLNGGHIKNNRKSSFAVEMNPSKPLFIIDKAIPGKDVLYHSLFGGYIDSFSTQQRIFLNEDATRIFLSNQTVIEMYKFAYSRLYEKEDKWLNHDPLNKRMELDTKTPLAFLDRNQIALEKDYETFRQKHLYSYDLFLPGNFSKNEALLMMIHDLGRFFKLKSLLKTKQLPCLKLVCISNKKLSQTIQHNNLYDEHIKAEANKLISSDYKRITLSERKISDLINLLNNYYKIPLVIEGIDYTKNVNMELNFKNFTLIDIREQLNQYGLDLVPATKKLNVLMLIEEGYPTKK